MASHLQSVSSQIVDCVVITAHVSYTMFEDEQVRLRSYRFFEQICDKEAFSSAGFFFNGIDVTCYVCALRTSEWTKDPWITHAEGNGACALVQIAKGPGFVECVRKNVPYIPDVSTTEPKCKVCLENTANILLLPCRHFATCGECKIKLRNCPICRQDTLAIIRIFV